jgi:hypothetical protein
MSMITSVPPPISETAAGHSVSVVVSMSFSLAKDRLKYKKGVLLDLISDTTGHIRLLT